MDPAVRKQTAEVDSAACCLDLIHDLSQDWVVGKLTPFNRPVDPGVVLIHDPSGSYIQMAYFGVAHLAFR